MSKFYFHFLHPGKEFDYKGQRPMSINDVTLNTPYKKGYIHPIIEDDIWGIRFGNEDSHKKKFLLHKGNFISKPPVLTFDSLFSKIEKDEYIYFWGEWEPQSFFKLTNLNDEKFPSQIHYPIYINREPISGTGCYSTDPYVYNGFYYTHCKQGISSAPKRLDKHLKSKNLSMILFGYEFPFSVKPNKFIIDTVFVIDKNKSHSSFICPSSDIFNNSNYYWGSHPDLANYTGVNFDSSKKNIFSFVPCIPFDDTKIIERPYLDATKYGLQRPGARTGGKSIPIIDDNELKDIWFNIVQDIFSQNWNLGVQINEPLEFPNYQTAYNDFLKIRATLKI